MLFSLREVASDIHSGYDYDKKIRNREEYI